MLAYLIFWLFDFIYHRHEPPPTILVSCGIANGFAQDKVNKLDALNNLLQRWADEMAF